MRTCDLSSPSDDWSCPQSAPCSPSWAPSPRLPADLWFSLTSSQLPFQNLSFLHEPSPPVFPLLRLLADGLTFCFSKEVKALRPLGTGFLIFLPLQLSWRSLALLTVCLRRRPLPPLTPTPQPRNPAAFSLVYGSRVEGPRGLYLPDDSPP